MANMRIKKYIIVVTVLIVIVIMWGYSTTYYPQPKAEMKDKKASVKKVINEENSSVFTLPESVTEITSQGYYENMIRLSGDARKSDIVLAEKMIKYPSGIVVGLVIEKEGKTKFLNEESEVKNIINIIEKAAITSNSKKNNNDSPKIKILLLNAKAEYVLSTITYIESNEFDIHISYPEEKDNHNDVTVIIESDKLLKKIQEI